MTTLAGMRDRVRDFVRDTNADEERRKVTDAEVDNYLREALADYSLNFPAHLVSENTPDVSITPPSDMLPGESSVYMVEVNGDTWTEKAIQEGQSLPTSGHYWYWRGGQITFASTPTTSVYVWYRGLYPFPSGDDEDFTVPIADEELLELYAASKFHQKLGTVSAKLDRFKERGERDDNPLVMMHEVLMGQYYQLVATRKHRGSVRVRKGAS